MTRNVPATLAFVAFAFSSTNALAGEAAPLQSVRPEVVCVTPAIPDDSQLIVIKSDKSLNIVGLPELTGETAKSYALNNNLAGYVGPGIDGLRTFYRSDRTDELFGANPFSQMSVIEVKGSYDKCFGSPPSIGASESIEEANQVAFLKLNLTILE
jgi:hypothetical protein